MSLRLHNHTHLGCSLQRVITSLLNHHTKAVATSRHQHHLGLVALNLTSMSEMRTPASKFLEAADIHVPLNAYSDWDDNKLHTYMELAKQWFDFLEHHTDFDQLIMETSNGRDDWIHVSCRANRKKNRHQIFRDMRKK